ncbi:hypothetical protein CANINC_001875 [Pichia inconspicua]|uniref:Zn(2)-C6 fungal-type domain-containing protein n=1 Tax=Pichia inconspicua TaxID=52247 RepID=A0A4T0X2Q7_9ASCO|nr:hypothetical protein CANINC_001875 [[Candida] inconspicua]
MTDLDKPKGRFKACTLCRKSKIKCLRDDDKLSCKRCQSLGLQCVFEYKVPSYKLANDLIIDKPTYTPIQSQSKKPDNNSNVLHINNILNPETSIVTTTSSNSNSNLNSISVSPPPTTDKNLSKWENSVEDRLSGFGSQLSSILDLLKDQQQQQHSRTHISQPTPINKKHILESPKVPIKRQKISKSPEDRLKLLLSRENASQLFDYFNKNISPQLFGFDISKYSIDSIWETCPLLIATISCISSIHHPTLSSLSLQLEKLVYEFSQNILFTIPDTEIKAFNSIIALCFCGFWFKNNQMFTGLALQLSHTFDLINPNSKSIIPKKDKLKLWYLLYILDGQQSLVFNRKSLIDSNQYTLKNSRKLLDVENENKKETNDIQPSVNADIRLISQVEYHQAINAVFEGQAWDLLTPSSFGLPFKSNLELDKWMVQWTVLLSPFKNNPIWSSKSTLIYYNFAKMHINSKAVRNFHSNGFQLPRFDDIDDDDDDFNSLDNNGIDIETYNSDSDTDDTDDADDDSIIKELSPLQSSRISAQLALSSAQTVLNIVLSDADILNALKYVPIHIHIMLYYAAVLILKSNNHSGKEQSLESSIDAIKIVKRLRHSVIANTPTDRNFSSKLVEALSNLIHDKVQHLKEEIGNSSSKLNLIDSVMNDTDTKELTQHVIKRNNQMKISAWPGYDPGHPTKSIKRGTSTSTSPYSSPAPASPN